MSKDGNFNYGVLNEGSYFGDISILLEEPNQYSYYYDPYQDRPIQLLQIPAKDFLEIVEKHPIPKEYLMKTAEEKKDIFHNYKTIKLISYMKTILRNPEIIS